MESIRSSFKQNFASCLDSKMRSFQFKILHRVLTTNIFLKKCKIKQDDKCTFCKNVPESIEHLFWDCSLVKKFWKNVSEKFKLYFNLNNYLNKKNVLLGVTQGGHKELANLIINSCKRYIYKTKFISVYLNVETVFCSIKSIFNIEQNIVLKRGFNMSKFEKKWLPVFPLFLNDD